MTAVNLIKLLTGPACWLLNRVAGAVDLGAIVNANRDARARAWSGDVWPDGEMPLITQHIADPVVCGVCNTEDIMKLVDDAAEIWATMPQQSSVSSGSATSPGVDPVAESPAPGAAQTPGVGHPLTATRIAAAIGLREYAKTETCEAPTYWEHIASQLDPNK